MAFGRQGVGAEARPAEAGQASAIEFDGRRGALFGLVLKNTILNLLTLGIYRFWAKTRLRRFFWSNVRVGGDPLEYTGLPQELFLGFLIVLAVLLPFGMAYGGIAVMAEGEPFAEAVANLAYLAVLYGLTQVAIYRAWRYRMSRTTWRAIRFGLDGSAWRFLWLALGWSALTVATLGLAYPYMRIALVRYRLSHSRFGTALFAFDGAGGDLIGSWIVVLLVPAAAAVIGLVFFSPFGALVTGTQIGPAGPAQIVPGLLLLVALPLGFVWYRVKEFRYMVGRTRFGGATFESRARAGRVVGLALATGAAYFGLAAVAALAFGLVMGAAAMTDAPGMGTDPILWWLVPVAIVAGVLLVPIIAIVIFRYGLVRHLCRTATVGGIDAFARAAQSADKGPKRGEGLADALDVGAF